jgi:hypothetical protein
LAEARIIPQDMAWTKILKMIFPPKGQKCSSQIFAKDIGKKGLDFIQINTMKAWPRELDGTRVRQNN